ncbi:unnamed protein product [Zymoseptoria tritici ST99CH_3D7]|uniref:Uncharacterized protein n=1 Tax=Zymoseptoria tritici (strain ST99CH_3D7) TaxID=1276538 RepID=A0A1X7RJ84_ZYMT9|nr:unnamed protein product [Zymoseptoria tritici ST99CH_3D7]
MRSAPATHKPHDGSRLLVQIPTCFRTGKIASESGRRSDVLHKGWYGGVVVDCLTAVEADMPTSPTVLIPLSRQRSHPRLKHARPR